VALTLVVNMLTILAVSTDHRPQCLVDRPQRVGHDPVPLVGELFRVHHLMMRIGDRLTAEIGLTASRWLLICALGELEGPTVGQLSEQAMLSPQAVSRMLAAMDAEGLVERVRSRADARVVTVRLTDAGRRAHERTVELAERFRGPFLDGLSESRVDRIANDLERLISNLVRFEHDLTDQRPAKEATS